jgi:hypothetical protein
MPNSPGKQAPQKRKHTKSMELISPEAKTSSAKNDELMTLNWSTPLTQEQLEQSLSAKEMVSTSWGAKQET